jgi:long-chain acyl-CoA synthetase
VAEIAAQAPGRKEGAAAVHRRRRTVGGDDLATLVYTSGTTGRPKGCELTHGNLLAEIKIASLVFPELLALGGSVLLFLPMAHVFGKVIQCGSVYTGTTIGHTSDVQDLLTDLAEFRPTFLLAVPRMFEKVHARIAQQAESAGRSRVFRRAEATAIAWSRALDAGGPGPALRLRHAAYHRLVYRKILARLGGKCVAAVSGGAPLGERLGHFFRGIGLPVYEGYGMTETSGGITINTPRASRIGTVGRPVPGASVRIAEDGEVLLRGRVIFRGYWDDPTATAEARSDGWLHSGDLGALDDAGFLRLTGRKKEIIVTAGGKNVAPAVLEDRLRAHPLISQCIVVGEARPFVGALITIDADSLAGWLHRHGKPAGVVPADLVDDPDLRREIDTAVAAANEAVSRAEAIRRYRILPADFTERGGELTPTMKLRRAVVEKAHASHIAAIYS